ncbi:MAG: hypothetical protein DRJ52_09750 [Thermoprotei archaeon]|nr:MAG: hypothetical protein DRJ52_09750 [Thermoprotei archaeon]
MPIGEALVILIFIILLSSVILWCHHEISLARKDSIEEYYRKVNATLELLKYSDVELVVISPVPFNQSIVFKRG